MPQSTQNYLMLDLGPTLDCKVPQLPQSDGWLEREHKSVVGMRFDVESVDGIHRFANSEKILS